MPIKARALKVSEVRGLTEIGVHALGHVAGLCLRITSVKTRLFCFRYQFAHKSRLLTIGYANVMPLSHAIKEASKMRAMLYSGIDPYHVRDEAKKAAIKRNEKEQKNSTISAHSFIAVANEYIKYKKDNKGFIFDKTAESAFRGMLINHVFPYLKLEEVETIEPKQIYDVLVKIWTTKRSLSLKLCSFLKQIFDYAIAQKYMDKENPVNMRGALGTLLSPLKTQRVEQGHYPCVDYHELPNLICAINEFSAVTELGRKALLFSILTATRAKAARLIKWDQINFDNNTWTIPLENDKNKKQSAERTIYLNEQAVTLLKSITHDSDYVFHNRLYEPFTDSMFCSLLRRLNKHREDHRQQPFVDKNILNKDGKPSLITQHGVARATFKIWSKADDLGNNTKFDTDAVEFFLLHTRKDPLKGAYDRSKFEKERKRVMKEWGEYCYSKMDVQNSK